MRTNVCNPVSKILTTILLLIIVLCNACQKDDKQQDEPKVISYTDLAIADIKAKEAQMSVAPLVISNSGGIYFKAGDILFYKTSLGNFGKMEVISVDQADNYKFTFKAVTYKADGTILSSCTTLSIRGTWLCDLDTMTEVEEDGSQDFWVERLNPTDTNLEPKINATFVRFTN
jgi:hypothetical protein